MSNKFSEIVFVAAKRTPFGAFGGSLAGLTGNDLAVHAGKGCIEQTKLSASEIDAVVMGNVCQSSKDAPYLARHVGLRLGAEQKIPALTVNRLCGSGFEAIVQGAYLIGVEDKTTVLVGGTESMSQIPYVLRGARFGYRMGNGEIEDSLTTSLTDSFVNLPMAITAENLATQYKISRQAVDEFALKSQKRAQAATMNGVFKNEIYPLTIKSKKGESVISHDEHIRPDASIESLQKLKPVFKSDGVVTAGNASGVVDGAACLIMTTQKNASAKGWPVLGRLVAWAAVGCDPKIMGIGPVPATQLALKKWSDSSGSSKSLKDIKRVEVNEAFAPQYLAVEKELGLDPETTNSNGGAIAIGHPLGASGARLVGHLLYDLKRLGGGYGLASACIGGGQGMSVIVKVD